MIKHLAWIWVGSYLILCEVVCSMVIEAVQVAAIEQSTIELLHTDVCRRPSGHKCRSNYK